jgi:hypothetical protein
LAGRKTFTAGEVLQAADVNDFLMDQSVMVFAGTAARGSAIPSPTEGMVTYLADSNEVQVFDGSVFNLLGGKILQVVRATDSTDRSTTSTSLTDASISVTITPTKDTSDIMLVWSSLAFGPASATIAHAITDNSDNPISGAELQQFTNRFANTVLVPMIVIGYASPATTSATTFKGRFRTQSGTTQIANSQTTGQLFAIEVSA